MFETYGEELAFIRRQAPRDSGNSPTADSQVDSKPKTIWALFGQCLYGPFRCRDLAGHF